MRPVKRDCIYVWETPPKDTYGLEPVVRAANGDGTTSPAAFDFAANYQRWVRHVGHALPAWSWIYPTTDGRRAARVLLAAAPHAPFYLLDVEEDGVSHNQLRSCAAALHRHAPVGITTWGQVGQAQQRHVPLGAYEWDIASPQEYYPYQIADPGHWAEYGRQVAPSVSPNDTPQWLEATHAGPVVVWRDGLPGIAAAAAKLHKRNHNHNWTEAIIRGLPTLKQGDKDPTHGRRMVARVQALLHDVKELPLGRGGVNGRYDKATTTAVKHLQGQHNLTVDGICGPHTWAVLITGEDL